MFKIAFVVIAGIIATRLLLGRDDWLIAQRPAWPAGDERLRFLIGLASSLMGISGGSLATLVLTLYGNRSTMPWRRLRVSVYRSPSPGPSAIVLAGLPHQSQLPPFSIGFVSVIGVVMVAPISSYVAPIGARLAHALPKRRLEIAFGVFLLAARHDSCQPGGVVGTTPRSWFTPSSAIGNAIPDRR